MIDCQEKEVWVGHALVERRKDDVKKQTLFCYHCWARTDSYRGCDGINGQKEHEWEKMLAAAVLGATIVDGSDVLSSQTIRSMSYRALRWHSCTSPFRQVIRLETRRRWRLSAAAETSSEKRIGSLSRWKWWYPADGWPWNTSECDIEGSCRHVFTFETIDFLL